MQDGVAVIAGPSCTCCPVWVSEYTCWGVGWKTVVGHWYPGEGSPFMEKGDIWEDSMIFDSQTVQRLQRN